MIWPGAVLLDCRGDPVRAIGGAMTIYPDIERAAAVAEGYSSCPSMRQFHPLRAAICRVTCEEVRDDRDGQS